MPFLKLETNVALEQEQAKTLVHGLSVLAADMLGKPESAVLAVVEPDKIMSFGGTDAPTAFVTLKSVGFPEDKAGWFSATICAFLEDSLSIPPDRVYIAFNDIRRSMIGWNSDTLEARK